MHISKNIASFDSLHELHDYMKQPGNISYSDWAFSDRLRGGFDKDACVNTLLTGDTACVTHAEKMLGRYDIKIPTDGWALQNEVVGFMPSVPDYLAGSPECMYGMEATHDARQPMSIYVNGACSQGITAEQMQKCRFSTA